MLAAEPDGDSNENSHDRSRGENLSTLVAQSENENRMHEWVSTNALKILLIDDEPDLVFLGERILSRAGHSVEGFTNPDLAMRRLESDAAVFDIVCSDLTMHETSGIDLAMRVRDIRPGLPVLIMSGCVRPEDARRAASLGLDEIITKPARIEDFPRLIQNALERFYDDAIAA